MPTLKAFTTFRPTPLCPECKTLLVGGTTAPSDPPVTSMHCPNLQCSQNTVLWAFRSAIEGRLVE